MGGGSARAGPFGRRMAAPRHSSRLGSPIANGSDFPVEVGESAAWILCGGHSAGRVGQSARRAFLPKERLTREQALRSWTLGAAYAAFEEKDKGSLEAGKLADFVVLSQDIMTIPPAEILYTQVRMTVVGGEIVYQAK